jgi:hypothetical protein
MRDAGGMWVASSWWRKRLSVIEVMLPSAARCGTAIKIPHPSPRRAWMGHPVNHSRPECGSLAALVMTKRKTATQAKEGLDGAPVNHSRPECGSLAALVITKRKTPTQAKGRVGWVIRKPLLVQTATSLLKTVLHTRSISGRDEKKPRPVEREENDVRPRRTSNLNK